MKKEKEAIEAWNKRVIPEGYVKLEDVIRVLRENGWNETFKECKIMTDRLISLIEKLKEER